jgi:antirestriction protein ArdC
MAEHIRRDLYAEVTACNVVLLWLARGRGWPTPRFLTFKQAAEAGGSVRKGEHGTRVVFVKQLRVIDKNSAEGDERHAGYIANWIELLRSDKRAFFTACSKAQAAADYLSRFGVGRAPASSGMNVAITGGGR